MAQASADLITPRPASRRAFLAVVGSAAAVAPAGASPPPPPDDPIIALYDEMQRLDDAYGDAREAADHALFAAQEQYPRRPLALYYKSRRYRGDGTYGIYLKKRERTHILRDRDHALSSKFGDPRKTAEHYAELLRISDNWLARCAAVRDATGATELERTAMAAWSRYSDALERFVETVPTTIRGVLLKIREVKTWNDMGTSETLDQLINGLAALDPATIGRA